MPHLVSVAALECYRPYGSAKNVLDKRSRGKVAASPMDGRVARRVQSVVLRCMSVLCNQLIRGEF